MYAKNRNSTHPRPCSNLAKNVGRGSIVWSSYKEEAHD